MAPRFAFRASKFRNIECSPAAREASYDQLQVTAAAVEGNALAAATDRFAFAHHVDGGAAIQVKPLSATGKETTASPPLLRGHQARVNTLEFSPFRSELLLSGSADATVKIWKLPADATSSEMQTSPRTISGAASPVVSIKHHPAAALIAAAVSHRDAFVLDVESEAVAFRVDLDDASEDTLSSLTWNYDGSFLLTSSLGQRVRLLDPRAASLVEEFRAHSGSRRPTSIVWCGRRDCFLTTGYDPMQERELKLWDPRSLAKPVARERLDASIGQLFPQYDVDLDLLYVMGKGDRSVRTFEVDETGIHKLNQTLLPHMTLAAALTPKQVCNTNECEIARVLNLSASGGSINGVCDVLSFTVPRKGALSEFQQDLYPQTLARIAALSEEQWRNGENAVPLLQAVTPTLKVTAPSDGNGFGSVFGFPSSRSSTPGSSTLQSSWNSSPSPQQTQATEPSTVAENGSGWGQATASPWSSVATTACATVSSTADQPVPVKSSSGWGSRGAAWNALAPTVAPSTATAGHQVQWFTPEPAGLSSADDASLSGLTTASTPSVPDKVARFTTVQEHKLKFIKGTQCTRTRVLNLGDKVAASNCIEANEKYMAIPLMGAGGPVLLSALGASGRVSSDDLVLDGHKATVTDLAFHPFTSEILAAGSGDATISIWNVVNGNSPRHRLRGHTKGVKSLEFHPRAADVLCSTSQDLSVRLWDVETGVERVCLAGKLEDSVWNAAFSPDGSLLATSSRARLVRVFDPRDQSGHALVAIGCGFESIRPQYVQWLSTHRFLTVGTTGAPRHETQLRIWDARNLVDALSTTVIDSAAAESVPFFDASSRVLFLTGVGGRHIWSYEIVDDTIYTNLPFVADGLQTTSAATLLPKRLCDVRSVEIDQLLLLRGKTVESVTFALPRNEKLREYFQDDVYSDIATQSASLSASKYFEGEQVVVEYESLRPANMTPLSEKPEETDKPVPMSQQFRAKWEAEEREKRMKAENLERLQALALQPSLYSSTTRATRGNDDSDDDWEE